MATKKKATKPSENDFSFFQTMKTGNAIADSGVRVETQEFIDTGCYTLNAIYSGDLFKGFPSNRMMQLAGEQAVGKTFFTIFGHCRPLVDQGYFIFYIDTESAVDAPMLESYGLSEGTYKILPCITVETVRKTVSHILDQVEAYNKKNKTRKKCAFMMDSLGNLTTEKAIQDTSDGKDTRDMTKQQGLKRMFSELVNRMGTMNIPWVITNNVYEKIGAYVPTKVVSGGSGALYNSSVILVLRKRDFKNKDKVQLGNIIIAKANKSRYVKNNAEVQFLLDFNTGLNKYYGLHLLAQQYGLLIDWVKSDHGPDSDTPIPRPKGLHHANKAYVLMDPSKPYTEWVCVGDAGLHKKSGIGTILDPLNEFIKKDFQFTSPLLAMTEEEENDKLEALAAIEFDEDDTTVIE